MCHLCNVIFYSRLVIIQLCKGPFHIVRTFTHIRAFPTVKMSPVKKACCRTYTNGLLQFAVVLRSQQRLVITRVALQLFLCTASRHPNPGPVLVRHTFTHIPFHFQNKKNQQLHDTTTPAWEGPPDTKQRCVCFLYLSSSSLHAASLAGVWTISWTFCWGQPRTRSSSPYRAQNPDVSRSRRGQPCRGQSTQSSAMYR